MFASLVHDETPTPWGKLTVVLVKLCLCAQDEVRTIPIHYDMRSTSHNAWTLFNVLMEATTLLTSEGGI